MAVSLFAFSPIAVSIFAFDVNFATVCHLVLVIHDLFSVDNELSDFSLPLASISPFLFLLLLDIRWFPGSCQNGTTVNSRRVGCSRLVGRCSAS